jgi:hypothetical protein
VLGRSVAKGSGDIGKCSMSGPDDLLASHRSR